MKLAHHLPEFLADANVTERVIVIIDQRSDPWDETVKLRVMRETVPEHRLRFLARERAIALSTSRRDQVHRVVAVPVLKTVFVPKALVLSLRAFAEAFHERNRTVTEYDMSH
jgi:hypothetical protein